MANFGNDEIDISPGQVLVARIVETGEETFFMVGEESIYEMGLEEKSDLIAALGGIVSTVRHLLKSGYLIMEELEEDAPRNKIIKRVFDGAAASIYLAETLLDDEYVDLVCEELFDAT